MKFHLNSLLIMNKVFSFYLFRMNKLKTLHLMNLKKIFLLIEFYKFYILLFYYFYKNILFFLKKMNKKNQNILKIFNNLFPNLPYYNSLKQIRNDYEEKLNYLEKLNIPNKLKADLFNLI